MWNSQVEAISKNYRFIRFEPRGHGKSDAPQDPSAYGLDTSAEDLLGLLDHLGIEKAYVGGLSMGGGITTRFTLLHQDRVAGLMVIDSGSAAGHAAGEEVRTMTARVRELAFTEGMEAVAQYSIEEVNSFAGRAARGPEAVEGIVEMFKALTPHGYTLTLEALDQAPAFDDRLSEISVPTLCIVGDEDPALGGRQVRPQPDRGLGAGGGPQCGALRQPRPDGDLQQGDSRLLGKGGRPSGCGGGLTGLTPSLRARKQGPPPTSGGGPFRACDSCSHQLDSSPLSPDNGWVIPPEAPPCPFRAP